MQASASYACMGHKMESASVWLGIAGLIGIAVLMSRSFRGSVFVGIFLTTVVAWIPGHAASYLGGGSPIPGEILGLTCLHLDLFGGLLLSALMTNSLSGMADVDCCLSIG